VGFNAKILSHTRLWSWAIIQKPGVMRPICRDLLAVEKGGEEMGMYQVKIQ
jgi:hypothetical protein